LTGWQGEYKDAISKYEKSNTFAASDYDLDKKYGDIKDSEKEKDGEEKDEELEMTDEAWEVANAKKVWAKETDRASIKKMKLSCYLNMAACQIKLDDAAAALKSAGSALDIEQENVKGLFRRGQAHLRLGDLDLAQADLMQAAKLDPKNKDARQELAAVKSKRAANHKKDKAMYGGMFG